MSIYQRINGADWRNIWVVGDLHGCYKLTQSTESQHVNGGNMTMADFERYQAESVKRASMPPIAKHSQTKANQPKNFVRIYQTLGETA